MECEGMDLFFGVKIMGDGIWESGDLDDMSWESYT